MQLTPREVEKLIKQNPILIEFIQGAVFNHLASMRNYSICSDRPIQSGGLFQ